MPGTFAARPDVPPEFRYNGGMSNSRADIRRKLNLLLALAARPGTKAEGATAYAKAVKLADLHGFKIQRKRPRGNVGGMLANFCHHCGQGFVTASTGRPRVYCSGRCRTAAFRARRVHS